MRAKPIALCMLAAIALVTTAAPAEAGDGETRGPCSGGPGELRLRVRHDDGSLSVRLEIDSDGSDQPWQLFISDNGTRIYARTKVSDDDGRVRVRRVTDDRVGSDRVSASGVNLDTGESCAATVSV